MKQAERRKFHYIYKITRIDGSGKYYIGMHSTDDLEDGYLVVDSFFGSPSKSTAKRSTQKRFSSVPSVLCSAVSITGTAARC